MSLFSGMRLTPGKKPTQSISAKVQDEGDKKTGDRGGSADIQPVDKSVPLSQKKTDDKVSDICAVKAVASAGTTALVEDVESASIITLKDTKSGASTGALTLKEDVESGAKSGVTSTANTEGGSMFSFITDTESDAHKKLDSEMLSETVDTEVSSEGDNSLNNKNTLKKISGDEDSIDAEFELDPFSVGKPAGHVQMSEASKLSFDLEGLDFAPVPISQAHTRNLLDDDTDLSLQENSQSYSPVDLQEDVDTVKESNEDLERGSDEHRHLFGTSDVAETASEAQYEVELSFADQLEVTLQMHKAKLRHFRWVFVMVVVVVVGGGVAWLAVGNSYCAMVCVCMGVTITCLRKFQAKWTLWTLRAGIAAYTKGEPKTLLGSIPAFAMVGQKPEENVNRLT